MKYDAFISYKHDTDIAFSQAVQEGLQHFSKPWNKLRAVNVFRDLRSLEPTADLPKSLEKALLNSGYLLVMASPGAAASTWVKKEISFWLKHKEVDKILIVHTGGKIGWNYDDNDFDWSHTTALPKVLKGEFSAEPYITSLTELGVFSDLSLDNEAFKEKIAGLSATLRGLKKEDLYGFDVDEHAKATKYRKLAVAGLGALAVLAALATGMAYNNALGEENQRLIALGRRAEKLAAEPGSEVNALIQGLLATERRLGGSRPIPEGVLKGLFAAVNFANKSIILDVDEEGISQAEFSPDGTQVLTAGLSGKVQLWQVDTGTLIQEILEANEDQTAWAARFSPDGSTIVTSTASGSVRLWDAKTGRKIYQLAKQGTPVRTVEFSPDGKRIAAGSQDGLMHLWSVEDGQLIVQQQSHRSKVGITRFSPDGAYLLSASWNFQPTLDGKIRLWDGRTGKWVRDLDGHTSDVRDVEFSADSTELLTSSMDNTVRRWNVATAKEVTKIKQAGEMFVVGLSRRYRRIISAGETGVIYAGSQHIETLSGHTAPITDMDFAKNGDELATASDDSTVRIWKLLPGYSFLEETLRGHSDGVTVVKWSPDETRIVSGGGDGKARIWTIKPEETTDKEQAIERACTLLKNHKTPKSVMAVCGEK